MHGDFSSPPEAGNKYVGVLHQQGRVWLESDWNADIRARLESARELTRDVVGPHGAPQPWTGFQITAAGETDFHIGGGDGPAGHYYVNGVLCHMPAPATYLTQPDLPDPPPLPALKAGETVTGLVYLETWPRLITHLEDPAIRDVALGGPDSATRLRTVAQVRYVEIPGKTPDCAAAAKSLPPAADGRLTVLPPADDPPADLCRLPDPADYTGRTNRLYCVRVHTGGTIGPPAAGGDDEQAVFKWSADNASFAVGVTVIAPDRQTLTVTALGRDAATALRGGDLVEVTDDAHELRDGHGHLTVLAAEPDPDLLTVRLEDALPAALKTAAEWSEANRPDRHLILRRWDGSGPAEATFVADKTPHMNFGDGVRIEFAGEALAAGDFWQFRAREADGSVGPLADAPPTGVVRFRSPLAIVRWTGDGKVTAGQTETDCRVKFPALTQMTQVYYVGGDGQEGAPGTLLEHAIEVGVSNGPIRLDGVKVQFFVAEGGGRLIPPAGAPGSTVTVSTSDGLASCGWELGQQGKQRVTASLVSGTALPVAFNAQFRAAPAEDDRVVVEKVVFADSGDPLLNDTEYEVGRIAGGIEIACDRELFPGSFGPRPTCTVTLELPYPLTPADQEFWAADQKNGSQVVGFQPIVLDAEVKGGERIRWTPTKAAQFWLTKLLFRRLAALKQDSVVRKGLVLAHLRVRGNFVWDAADDPRDPRTYLDGDTFGLLNAEGKQVHVRFKSGDDRRGGDFEMWFWLRADQEFAPREIHLDIPREISIGQPVRGTVKITPPAGDTSEFVRVTANPQNILFFPAQVEIPAQADTAKFDASGFVAGETFVTAATADGVSDVVAVTVRRG